MKSKYKPATESVCDLPPPNNPTTQVPVSVVDWPDNEIAEKWIWFKFGFVLRKFLFPNHIPRFVKT